MKSAVNFSRLHVPCGKLQRIQTHVCLSIIFNCLRYFSDMRRTVKYTAEHGTNKAYHDLWYLERGVAVLHVVILFEH